MRPFKSLFVLKQLSKHCKLFPRLLEHYIIRNNSFFFRISGATVCLDNLSFVLCTSFIIKKEKRIGVSNKFWSKNQTPQRNSRYYYFFPLIGVSVTSFVIRSWLVILKVTPKAQTATKASTKCKCTPANFLCTSSLWKPYKGLYTNVRYL